MEKMDKIINKKLISDILENQVVEPLADVSYIEDVLFFINDCQGRVNALKDFKKKRSSSIDSEISKFEGKIDFLKSILTETLCSLNKKSYFVPGVASLSRRQSPHKWDIIDEESLIEHLKKENKDKDVTVTSTLTKIDKKALSTLLNTWEEYDMLPECIKKIEGKDSITVRFEKEFSVEIENDDNYESNKIEQEPANLDF